jgi:hypothetical protein
MVDRVMIVPLTYLTIVIILFTVAARDLHGGEQFLYVFILGLPWTLITTWVADNLPSTPATPILSRIALFIYFVVICAGLNAVILYLIGWTIKRAAKR